MEIQAELRLRHAAVIRARRARGWGQRKLAKRANVSLNAVQQLEWLQFKSAHVRAAALKVAAVLGLASDIVLPPDMDENIESNRKITRHIDPKALLTCHERMEERLILPAPDQAAEAAELSERLSAAMCDLSLTEQRVLKLRFGLDGERSHTLEECAKILKRTRERIRTIEGVAIRRLRSPRLFKVLKSAIPADYDEVSARAAWYQGPPSMLYHCPICERPPTVSANQIRCWACDIGPIVTANKESVLRIRWNEWMSWVLHAQHRGVLLDDALAAAAARELEMYVE